MSVQEHKRTAPKTVQCMVVTISDTRDVDTDKSGKLIMDYLESNSHVVEEYVIVQDNFKEIKNAVIKGSQNPNVDVVITNGGTGIGYRDVTIETLQPIFDKEIVGFGELFRMLSYQEDIGSAAILSRAVAGVMNHTAVFSTPGSSGAVKLAMNKLILPELTHVVREIKKDL